MLKMLKNCLYVIVSSIILCSCGSGSNKHNLAPLTSITIDQGSTINTNVGLKTKITATAHYANNTTQPIPSTELTLVSANPNIASISATIGSNDIFVMGVATGETTITASFKGIKSSETTVKVSAATLQSITIDQGSTIETNVGLKTKITATAHYADNSTQPIPSTELTLVSTDSNIASIMTMPGNNDIFVMGVATGETTITASFNGIKSSETTVKVSAATINYIAIDQGPTINTNIGLKTKVTATIHYSDGTTQPVPSADLILVSANPNIASVSATLGDIFVVGVTAGETTITASFNDIKSVETTVKVSDAIVQSITIDQGSTIETNVGLKTKITATAHYSDGTNQSIPSTDLILVSANPNIASISFTFGDIFVMGVATGETTITASFNDVKSSATVKVSAATIQSITIDQGSIININVGLKTEVTATAHYSDGTNQPVPSNDLTWVSDKPNYVRIVTTLGSNDVFIEGLKVGISKITATFNNITSKPTVVRVKSKI